MLDAILGLVVLTFWMWAVWFMCTRPYDDHRH